jgi:hypothetical protein
MPVRPNALDQQLDIKGSINVSNTRTLIDESSNFGTTTASGTGDTIGGTAPDMTLTDAGATFTAQDVGRYITIVGATTGANDGSFLISAFTSSTVITYQNAAGVAEAFTGTYTVRDPYSLEDDINFARTDRKLIKGTASHVTAIPTYQRPTAVGTNVDANLSNIAGKTLDAKAIVNTRLYRGQVLVNGTTSQLVTDTGNLPHSDAVDTTGVPVFDGYDAGNHDSTYVDIIDTTNTNSSMLVSGKATGTLSIIKGSQFIDGETFVLNDGVNPAVTFEFDSNSSVVQTATLRAVTFTGGDSANTIRTSIIAAITNSPTINIRAVNGLDVAATGSITTISGAGIVDGETFVLNDGVNPAVTFEFDSNSSVVQTATLRAVTFTGGDSANTIRDSIITAVNGAPTLNITASNGGAALVSLVNDLAGYAGNVTITETVANAGFIVTGMSGGTTVINLTNNVPGTFGNISITETVANANFTVTGMSGGTTHAGYRIYGRTISTGATEPNSVVVAFRKVAPGAALSTSIAYTWEQGQPLLVDLYYGYRERMDLMSETAGRVTLVNNLIGDAGLSQGLYTFSSILGTSAGDTSLTGLTNKTNFYVFSTLDSTPSVTEAFNALNTQIGNRDYTGSILTDGQSITASLQALSSAISASNITRVIERLTSQNSAGVARTLPGGNTYTLDGTNNGANLYLYVRGLLWDPGPITGDNNYAETSTTSFTPYQKIDSKYHINYFIVQ